MLKKKQLILSLVILFLTISIGWSRGYLTHPKGDESVIRVHSVVETNNGVDATGAFSISVDPSIKLESIIVTGPFHSTSLKQFSQHEIELNNLVPGTYRIVVRDLNDKFYVDHIVIN